MMPSSAELLYFAEVANTLNLSRAAEKLAISQPALSLAIKRLEQTIGTHLLIRDKSGVYLTQAGKKLLLHTKQLLQYWEMTKSQSLETHQKIQGNISIGCHSTVAPHINQLLPNILKKHTQLSLHIKHDISVNIIKDVIDLSLDVGIVTTAVKHPDLITRKLLRGGIGFFTGLGNHGIQQINSGNAILIYNPDLLQSQLLLKKCTKNNIHFARSITTNSLEIAANLVANNAGIGILPFCTDELIYPQKIKFIDDAPTYSHEISLIYRKENRDVQSIRLLTTTINDFFQS